MLFDMGHGAGSFSWTVAETCVKADMWPTFISTDLHVESCNAPAYDMPTCEFSSELRFICKDTKCTRSYLVDNPPVIPTCPCVCM